MRYQFLIDTYETERLKVLSVWSMFRDADLPVRPHHRDPRGRSVHEQMVHQCLSEDLWFRTMLDVEVGVPSLPDQESSLQFITQYAAGSAARNLTTIVRFLGKRGASLDVKNGAGLTPHDLAKAGARRGQALVGQGSAWASPNAVDVLLELGAMGMTDSGNE